MRLASEMRCLKSSSDGWEVITVRTLEQVENIRPIWKSLQAKERSPAINADVDRYLSVIKASGGDVQPHIMVFRQNGEPVAMIIGRVEKHQLKLKLGYKTLLKPTLRCLTVVYGGIIGQPANEVSALLIRELMNTLNHDEVDMVQFNHLRTDSPVYQLARKMPGVLSRGYFPKIETHWSMSVPEDIDLFYQSRSTRHRANLRRYIRKLEKEYEGRVKMVTYSKEGEVECAVDVAAKVSSKTYQHGMGCGFVNDSRSRTLLKTAAKWGWFRAYVLVVDEEPCAFQLMLRYGRVCYLDQIGFDPRWKKYCVGTVLFLYVLKTLCADSQVDYIDFYFGDAEYKRHYGTEHWLEASAYIFAPRLYPIFVNVFGSSTRAMSLGLEYFVNKMGFVRWIKRRWRNLLQKDSRH